MVWATLILLQMVLPSIQKNGQLWEVLKTTKFYAKQTQHVVVVEMIINL